MEEDMHIQNNDLVPIEQELNNHTPEIQTQTQEEFTLAETQTQEQFPPQSKRRKKKSIVWEHFTIQNISSECRRASCNECKQSFAYSTGPKVAGTSHLKRHIAKGGCHVALRNQGIIPPYSAPSKLSTGGANGGANGGGNGGNGGSGGYVIAPKRRYRTTNAPYFSFDPDRCRREIAKMIILHDYPLHMVEHPGFIAFVQNLQPRFNMVSFNTVQGDCVATYLHEKQNLQKVIESIPGRICLSLDTWSSCLGFGYVFITGHFLDSEWKIHRKILNVVMEPFPEAESAFSHAISACITDWNIEKRVFSVTVNQKPVTNNNIRELLSVKNPVLLNGQLIVNNCLARTLSKTAQEAMRFIEETIIKVRDSVKYVKTSETHEEKFFELKSQLQVPSTRVLLLDDKTKWNTTYEMLLAAAELKEVFSCLDTTDPDYENAPSVEDWKVVETLCVYLKPLFDTASILVNKTVPTTNIFFQEVWKIELELARASLSEDKFISGVSNSMKEIFNNYWNNSCFVLAIAVVMDPRFKMKLVEFNIQKIYGVEKAGDYLKIVDEGLHELFVEYMAQPGYFTPEVNNGTVKVEVDSMVCNDDNGLGVGLGVGLGLTDFDMFIMQSSSQQSKSELDQYLEESVLPRVHDFDVIGWWKLNRLKYPTLSKMACDILSIPVFTVGVDSVFDTIGKEMDKYRCTLRPETVEALISAKDWLQDQLGVEDNNNSLLSNAVVKMEGVVPI